MWVLTSHPSGGLVYVWIVTVPPRVMVIVPFMRS
jgi:hypothetical protein